MSHLRVGRGVRICRETKSSQDLREAILRIYYEKAGINTHLAASPHVCARFPHHNQSQLPSASSASPQHKMSGAYTQARMQRQIFSRPRKPLKSPDRPLALRQDYITNTKAILVLCPQGDAHSAAAYKVKDQDGQTVFTASGWKYNNGSCREVRNATGLPLFELHRKISLKRTWYITLPGDKREETLATASPRFTPAFGNFNITLKNAVACDTKSGAEMELTLAIERHGRVLQSFDVVHGDRRVAEVCESVRHNDRLALTAGARRGYRPALDIVVAPAVDMALVCLNISMAKIREKR